MADTDCLDLDPDDYFQPYYFTVPAGTEIASLDEVIQAGHLDAVGSILIIMTCSEDAEVKNRTACTDLITKLSGSTRKNVLDMGRIFNCAYDILDKVGGIADMMLQIKAIGPALPGGWYPLRLECRYVSGPGSDRIFKVGVRYEE